MVASAPVSCQSLPRADMMSWLMLAVVREADWAKLLQSARSAAAMAGVAPSLFHCPGPLQAQVRTEARNNTAMPSMRLIGFSPAVRRAGEPTPPLDRDYP